MRVDAGKHVDFCRGSILSTAERSSVTYFTIDKAYGRAAVSQRVVSVSDGKTTECFYDTRILWA